MLKKRNLLFLSLLILGILLLTSCFLQPPETEGLLKGQVLVPEGTLKNKDLTGQALPDATVNIIDLSTGAIIATTTTDADGNYQVFVPAGGPYLLEAASNGIKVQQITPQVEVAIEYDLGTADCTTTAVALIVQAMLDAGVDLADINLADIEADPNFDDVLSNITSIIEAGGDPTTSAAIEEAVEDFLNPPSPTPTPAPTPTYTVTYDGNGNTGGTIPTDANAYESGETVTISGNTGSLEKSQDGISLLFIGWNTASDGSGIDYLEADTFSMGSSNVILYAKWSVLRGTGPAGGLIFYDKGSVSDGWRYLEAALSDQSTGIQWYNSADITTSATGIALGTGPVNTIKIIDSQGETTTAYAAGLARAYSGGSYDDWFLPSKDELNQMYTNLHNISTPVGGFDAAAYWSSTEFNASRAWFVNFFGGQFDDPKNLTLHVRAARAFRSIAPTYIVNYNANGSTGGTVPLNAYHYEPGESVSVSNNTGSLVKTGCIFDGWNTKSDGSGIDQAESSNFPMGNDNVTLFAKWITTIDIAAIPGVTTPVTGATPITTITETTQYTGTVSWSPAHNPFQINTTYTATITLTPKTGYTLTDVTENFFTVAGAATVTNTADSGVVTASFPETADFTIDIAAIPGVTTPVTGATPVTTITETAQYIGTVTWSPDHGTFAGTTTYTTTITLAPKTGYTLTGVTEDFFTVAGADPVSNAANSGVVTASFPETAAVAVGDNCGGGKVAYILQSGDPGYVADEQHGLIAATSDQSGDIYWHASQSGVTGATETALGKGKENTETIISFYGSELNAAKLCADYINSETGTGVYNDWFLPSNDELQKLHTNRVAIGGFTELGGYWSSSEYDVTRAWARSFLPTGINTGFFKDSLQSVRAVRYF